jgi:hypothetical protein
MFKRITCLMVVGVLLFSTTPAFAAGPIGESVKDLGQATSAQQQSAIRQAPSGDGLFWSGLALIGAGVAVEVLSYSAWKNETVVGCGRYLCIEESTNRTAMAAGAAMGLTGYLMQAIGWKKMHPMITFGPRPSVGVRVGF